MPSQNDYFNADVETNVSLGFLPSFGDCTNYSPPNVSHEEDVFDDDEDVEDEVEEVEPTTNWERIGAFGLVATLSLAAAITGQLWVALAGIVVYTIRVTNRS